MKEIKDKKATLKEKNGLPTVLVVDDNADMREHISKVLSNHFNIITATNGIDALKKMKETIPALVLSEIKMPVMDGIGLLKEIKNNKATATIPVLFLTTPAEEEYIAEDWESGPEDYIIKPFSAKELLSRIKSQIKIVKLRNELESNVRNLFMEAHAIICVHRGPEHVFELSNKIHQQVLGNRDIIGKTVREAMPDLEGSGIYELLDHVYFTGEHFVANEYPVNIDRGNGKLEAAYFNFVYQPTHDIEGKIDGLLVHGVEITEQVLSRKKIEANKNQLQTIFLNAPAAIAVFEGPQQTYILANKAYEKLSNRKAADLLGKNMLDLFPELKGTGTLELFEHVLQTGESFSAPEYALMLDLQNEGVLRQYYFNFSMEPLKNNSGEIYAVMAVTYDITEQVELKKKIEDNEKQFKNVLLESPNIFVILEGFPEMIITFANEPLFKSWGRSADIIGKPFLEAIPEVKDQPFPKLLQQVFESGETYISGEEKAVIIKNGVPADTYYHYVYQPIFDNTRKVTGITIMATDITEQVLARKKTEESEAKYKSLIAAAPIGIGLLKGRDLILESANQHYKDLIGKGNHIEGKKFTALMPELVGQPYLKILDDIFTTGKSYQSFADPVSVNRNGILQHEFYDINYAPLFDGEGKVYAILNIATDVTVQTLFNNKLKESESRFRTIADASPILIWTLDANGLYSYYNKTFLDFIGVAKEEDISNWAKIVHPDDVQSTLTTINTAIAEHHSYTLECRLLRADGQWRWMLAQGTPRTATNNEFLGFVGSSVDITESKRREANLEFLAGINLDFAPLLTTQEVMNHVSERLANFLHLSRCHFSIVDEEHDRLEVVYDFRDDENLTSVRGVYQISDVITDEGRRLYNSGKMIVLNTVEDCTVLKASAQVLKEWGIGSLIDVPHLEAGEWKFVLTITRAEASEWQSHEIELLQELTSRIYIRLERANAEEAVRKSEEQLSFDLSDTKRLQTISTKLIHEENIDLLYEHLLNAAIGLMRADMGSIQLYHSKKNQLQLLTYKGFHAESAAHWEWVSTDTKSVCAAALHKGERLIVNDIEEDEQTLKTKNLHYYQLSGIRGVQSTPLISRKGELLGMLSTHWRKPHQPSERDLQFFDVLARQAADLIDRKQTEEKIAQSEKRLQLITDSLPVLISYIDKDQKYRFNNTGYEKWFGQTRADVYGKQINEVLGDAAYNRIKPYIDKVLSGEKVNYETFIPYGDNEERYVLVNYIPDFGKDNIVKGFYALATDINERKKAEEIQNEFAKKLESQVQLRTKELIKSNEELSQFAYVTSHDLNEPLRKIKNFISCLVAEEKETLSESGKHYLERTYSTAKRMQSLIDDLLAYSRFKKGELKFEKTNLNIILNQVKDDLKEAIQETFAVINTQELCEINCIPFQMRQLLNNLISNALKFSCESLNAHIDIKCEIAKGNKFNSTFLKDYQEKLLPKAAYCHISIADNGIGFDSQYNERMFEVFQRLHDPEQYKGTGIGLAICKKIVINHNGIITAKGKVNEGATFDIFLPVE